MQDPDSPPVVEGKTDGGEAAAHLTIAGTQAATASRSKVAFTALPWITVTAPP
jgi:hypothetical protein